MMCSFLFGICGFGATFVPFSGLTPGDANVLHDASGASMKLIE